MDIKLKYGICIIPMNTVLFNSAPKSATYTNLFLGLKLYVARAFHEDGRQLFGYRVKQEFEILFMLKELSRHAHLFQVEMKYLENIIQIIRGRLMT